MKKNRDKNDNAKGHRRRHFLRFAAFPLVMTFVYGFLALVYPSQTMSALKASGKVLLQVIPALIVAFGVMVLVNLWISPASVKRFLGSGKELRLAPLSSVAGILSMGSIYVWYPLLKDFREKGVPDFHLANFLGCRAVKIPLMPLMAAYFGWKFTLILSALLVFDAVLTGLVVSSFGSSR